MIDTHSHIYAEEFDADIAEAIQRSKAAGVKHIILPNIDSESLPRMLALEAIYPDYCSAAIGLHPTSVKAHYKDELAIVKSELERRKYIAVGEIGIDLYWDKTFLQEQIIAFQQQIEWALFYKLPIIIHTRNSFQETMNALQPFKNKGLRGVFHSFGGTVEEAEQMLEMGDFLLGINGIVTFKNSGLAEILSKIDIRNIILETDSPYLTPNPHRGKRNESAYLGLICKKIADIYELSIEKVSEITTQNSSKLFKIN